MAKHLVISISIVAFVTGFVNSAASSGKRCTTPPLAPLRIQKVIGSCQDEIKIAIITEALNVLSEEQALQGKSRSKRETFTDDEKKIAGCLLQCVYRKVKAVDQNGFPTTQGLVNLYTEGVAEQGYLVATYQAVQQCLGTAYRKHTNLFEKDAHKHCDVAFDVFECVSDKIGEYCGHTP
ncbi:general odorant-binding protein 70 [Chrysoperla carnea]|uniref:general odorant-binding protein 70 n=1 Tax=Chrysoperla carnea TaxID=189513 RepID=UPI001D06711E|nr:general odorant-binding protein 70 [Chrysoperla carnea]